ncbi:cobalt transporter CbiM [Litoribacillus peritrichatus]|uniref:Cobalt transporter CbiM n=1 Tax=Litoribacillus peritrichatus TaxID=718191 RepID=A0ABP7MEV4_9GAMM
MAHIPDGVLALPVVVSGALATATLAGLAFKRLNNENIPQAAVLAAAFFVSSLVSVPVGPSSVHLLLNGLMGVILGWTAVPAILVALLMQAIFFGHGGLIALGVNAFNIAAPALLCGFIIRPFILRSFAESNRSIAMLGACAGLLGAGLTGVLVGLSLVVSGSEYLASSKVILATYIPLILAEAAITAVTLSFISKVSPELLGVKPS